VFGFEFNWAIGGSLKGFLAFCVTVVVIGLAGVAVLYVQDRGRAHEARLVGALNFTEEKIEQSLDWRASLFKPSIVPGTEQGQWVVSGIIVRRNSVAGTGAANAPFQAVLKSVCAAAAEPSCWRMVDLAVDGQQIEALQLAAAAPAVQVGAAARDEPGGVFAEGTMPPAADLAAGETSAMASAEPFDVSATLVTQPVEAAAAAPLPATPVAITASAGADTADGGAALTPAESALSNRELTRFVQDALARLNYKPGPSDGQLGPQTADAIRAYQRDFDLVPDGLPSIALLRHLRAHLADLGQQSGEPAQDPDKPSG